MNLGRWPGLSPSEKTAGRGRTARRSQRQCFVLVFFILRGRSRDGSIASPRQTAECVPAQILFSHTLCVGWIWPQPAARELEKTRGPEIDMRTSALSLCRCRSVRVIFQYQRGQSFMKRCSVSVHDLMVELWPNLNQQTDMQPHK